MPFAQTPSDTRCTGKVSSPCGRAYVCRDDACAQIASRIAYTRMTVSLLCAFAYSPADVMTGLLCIHSVDGNYSPSLVERPSKLGQETTCLVSCVLFLLNKYKTRLSPGLTQ